ncbi:hypothetical protein [Halobacterium sp. R2-5]|uniref:hypothetical protein n=1 Tax=Halobacterium sp. R2-5 TaxID=2715751 RepID=UPI001422B8F2|nr:hypothetical protein [Halobacterium sp. R2-5]NIB98035.1 hypothetical protein [Halobacterium sp. R2-5]
MANRTETIGVRVTEAEKQKFEQYAEEHNEFDSASRMLRVLAHRHINGEGDGVEASIETDELVDAMDVALSGVHERLDRMENHVVAIDSATDTDDDVDKLAREIYAALPVYNDTDDLPGMEEVARALTSEQQSDHSQTQLISSPSVWANYFGADEAQVRKACMRMLDYFPDVEYVTSSMGGYDIEVAGEPVDIRVSERRYFKTEDD